MGLRNLLLFFLMGAEEGVCPKQTHMRFVLLEACTHVKLFMKPFSSGFKMCVLGLKALWQNEKVIVVNLTGATIVAGGAGAGAGLITFFVGAGAGAGAAAAGATAAAAGAGAGGGGGGRAGKEGGGAWAPERERARERGEGERGERERERDLLRFL
jgi:hypothetical protein